MREEVLKRLLLNITEAMSHVDDIDREFLRHIFLSVEYLKLNGWVEESQEMQ